MANRWGNSGNSGRIYFGVVGVLIGKTTLFFFSFLIIIIFYFLFIFLLYNIVLVLPYIDMNPPRVYMFSPSWTSSHLPPHPVPLSYPNAPALSALYHASNLDWWSISNMINIHVSMLFSQIIPPSPSPTESKRSSLHLCLFCCLVYRVIITIFLNSIYMCYYTILVVFFWLTSLCIIGSSFIHLIRTDSNVFF